MSDKSGIEWTDSTWNPVTGCSKVSPGCKNCYALREWPRLAAPRPKPNVYTGRAFTDVAEHMERLEQPLHWTKPRRIFVNSMSDLFHEHVSERFIADVFGVMSAAHWHVFQVLTKRAQRMHALLTRPEFVAMVEEAAALYSHHEVTWPLPNVWLGVSAENQDTANERIPALLDSPARVRFASLEPLLGDIRLGSWLQVSPSTAILLGKVTRAMPPWTRFGSTALDQVIAGGESGPKARPSHPDWFRSLRDECTGASVAFFFKQWGEWWEVDSDYRDDETGDHRIVDADGIEAGERFDPATDCLIAQDGRVFKTLDSLPPDVRCRHMTRLGKKASGRHLDGRTHDGMPQGSAL